VPPALPSIQAALALRRTEDLRAARFAGLRRALPERLEALLLFTERLMERRRAIAFFFFAILPMVGSLFLFSLMIVLPNNESTILSATGCEPFVNCALKLELLAKTCLDLAGSSTWVWRCEANTSRKDADLTPTADWRGCNPQHGAHQIRG